MIYLQLFYEFFKTGLFAIGGGLATLPFLNDLAVKTGWYTHAQLADMIAISESTPGPIGINTATYVGYTAGGVLGSFAATLGLVAPSIIIIIIIARILASFKDSKIVKAAFYGLRPASTGLIAAAGWSVVLISLIHIDLYKQTNEIASLFDMKAVILAVILYIFTQVVKKTKGLHPVVFLAASALAGILFNFAGI